MKTILLILFLIYLGLVIIISFICSISKNPMKIPEWINEKRIELIAWWKLRGLKPPARIKRVLVFGTRLGMGNALMLKPTLAELVKEWDITFVYRKDEVKWVIESLDKNIHCVKLEDVNGCYDACICNVMEATKDNVLKIIELKIPIRIAHRMKFKNVFNRTLPFDNNISEIEQNLQLCKLL